MRLFSAVAIAPEAQREIARVQAALAEWVEVRRWQPAENMHITVHFFGEVPAEAVPLLSERMVVACRTISPFRLQLGSLGAFPKRGQPQVLWVGVDDVSQSLHELERTMRTALADLGILEEARPYSPHITLARKPKCRALIAELAAAVPVEPIVWQVDHASLYQSVLTPQGAQYSVLQRFPFHGVARG